jgi:streptogramin lyase
MRRIGGSIRVAGLAAVVATVAFVAVLANRHAGTPNSNYGSPVVASGLLVGNPLVAPGVESFVGGQQQAAEVARRADPQAVAAREQSRSAYRHLASSRIGRLLGDAFPGVIRHQASGAPRLPKGARIVGYPSAHSAQLVLPGHQIGIVESTWPLAKRGANGQLAPIDLTLKASGGGYSPARSSVSVHIPSQLSRGVSTPQNSVTLTPIDSQGRALTGRGAVEHSSVIYANTQQASDTVVKPTPTGFQMDEMLRSLDSPQQMIFKVDAPSGATLAQDPVSGFVHVLAGGTTLATILPPGAKDAAGTTVPASMSVTGDMVTVNVGHKAGSYLYPIDVDPEINDSQLATTSGGKRGNWVFKSSNEAKFGHSAVYEGPGKEHLETTGIAEYKATEFAYWAYETKGNSKIYEVKTKTSAKNKLAKIESILQFSSSAGNENWKMLSNELEEPEYSEKISTICAWNPSKVEECLPAAGKEKNALRFQQSATASPGANFKFSDTMSEGIVSISEPAGEHSTTKFNTASPEVEGEVIEEGKKVMQKRTNALYGSGIWLTKFKGALQFIAEDPGIGVSRTHLEYEKSAGSWETLSEHNYLEENLCQGVQCFQPHNEYWTVDPKLPDGEDKIRYRAIEAIAGTESLSTEPESTKTVKVDTSKPHNISLGGIPFGNELSERKYVLTSAAIDGTGSTVASSGIEKIKLFIAGHEIAEHGTQTGCSVSKGECVAKAEWEINGAELGAGHHAIVIVATDKAGNEALLEETISIRHSTPVALGPGSVDLQSGDYALSATDVSMGSGLTVARNYSSRALEAGDEGPLGPQWSLNLGATQSIVEMPDHSVLLADAKGQQSIFAALEGGEFESPTGDSSLKLRLEENKTTKEKLAYYLENIANHTKTKFTLAPGGSKVWVPTKQEGTVATDTVTYAYQTAEATAEYTIPFTAEFWSRIVAGPDGNLWFTGDVGEAGKIGKVGTSGVGATSYAMPGSPASDITSGPEGNLWFATYGGKLGKITPLGKLTEYSRLNGGGGKLTTGSDGNLWITNFETNKIEKSTTSGAFTQYSVPAGSEPSEIAAGPDGNVWFTDWKTSKIGKITPSGAVTEYSLPVSGHPEGIVAGPDNNLWFTVAAFKANKVGKITTTGSITEYSLPESSSPGKITAGPDGNLWFTETSKIGKVTTAGVITEYALPAGSTPDGITAGPDGKMWFVDSATDKVATITTSGTITEPTEALAPIPAGVSCSPMKAGCRALKFTYASSTTATGEGQSEWGAFKGRLVKVLLNAYNPSSKVMQETAIAEYSYDARGRLRAEWDPRISPALKTAYGYDAEGHVTALTPPGQESWAFRYGATAGDAGTGRLLGVTRAPASETLWSGAVAKNTGAPAITGTPALGVRLAVSNGTWTGGPIRYGYQWEDCDSAGEACAFILGANNANYTPVAGDVGHKLRALVTGTNGDGSVVATSSASSEVKNVAQYAGGSVRGITKGPDGNMWVAESAFGITKLTPSGVITKYKVTSPTAPYGITPGPDGNLWFTDATTKSKIGKITTAGSYTEYALPNESFPMQIAEGTDAEHLWFTDYSSNKIGKITTAGVVTEYALPAGSAPYGIIAGPDGNIWYTDSGTSKIGKITNAGVITEYALPAGSQPKGIAVGPDGKLWFTNSNMSKIGKITTTGTITEYALPTGSNPDGITKDSNNNLSFIDRTTSNTGYITTAGVVTEYLPLTSGRFPESITSGPEGNLWYTTYNPNVISTRPPSITEGTTLTPSAGVAIEYGVPLSSGSGLQSMTSSSAAKWGQTDIPVEGTAILPPDARQGWPPSSYTRATTYYLDAQGRTVNTSGPSNASYGSVETTEYNEFNDVVRTLSPNNRQKALEAGSESVDTAKLLATYYSYREECSLESENRHETESAEPGTRLCDVEGPQHMVKYMAGSEQKEALARMHTKYFYDENAPAGETYNLATTTVTLTELTNEAKEELEGRVTKTSYSGQSNLGWKLRAPTSVTVDPEGKKLTTTTLYNSSTGQITETRAPAGPSGGSAHDTKLIYYTAEANTEGYSACGSHPEWAGLLCESLPAKQPESGGLPQLPVIATTYNIWNEPLVTTETFGSTVRTKTRTYDEPGRLATNETTSSANTALPKVTNEYNSKTGILEKQSTTVESKTTTVTSKYDALGELTEYADADGNVATYRYGGPENDGLLEEMTDGSNAGTGKQTYTYNATTKRREELTDSAAGVFKASYDAEGNLASEVYPNAMCANYTRNSVGEATHIEYIKTTNCSESGAPVWFNETRNPSVRGETFSRSSTLASETYAYDTVGRLTETHETPVSEGCTVRLYGYDEESNRTSQTTWAPGAEGKCATEGGTVLNHTYDEGNRLTDAGISYDAFGNVTKLSAADAEGHELVSTFYVDNAVATQSQNGVSNNYYLDPEGRVRETVSGINSIVTHYDTPGEAVVWTSESGGKSTRNVAGIDGTLSATQTNGATPILQLHDLQGNIIATAALSPSETKLLSTYNSTEFGVPNKEKAPPKFAWLGAGDVASALSSGVITYGATSYVPQTGRALQSEAVEPPGAPQGSGGGAAYVSQEEPWVFQGAAAAGSEAPGREAAREQAALEAAWAAATDPVEVHYMNKTKARALAKKLWEAKTAGELAGALAIPVDWVDAAVGLVAGLGLGDVYKWFDETAEMMSKCGNNKWNVVGVKPDICKIQYDVIHALGQTFVDFTTQAKVWVCFDNSGDTCFHEVYADKKEKSCAFGIICIA